VPLFLSGTASTLNRSRFDPGNRWLLILRLDRAFMLSRLREVTARRPLAA